jgi:hypothetical protein
MLTWIVNLCSHAWGCCAISVVLHSMETLIVGCHHYAEGYGDGAVMVPHMET